MDEHDTIERLSPFFLGSLVFDLELGGGMTWRRFTEMEITKRLAESIVESLAQGSYFSVSNGVSGHGMEWMIR